MDTFEYPVDKIFLFLRRYWYGNSSCLYILPRPMVKNAPNKEPWVGQNTISCHKLNCSSIGYAILNQFTLGKYSYHQNLAKLQICTCPFWQFLVCNISHKENLCSRTNVKHYLINHLISTMLSGQCSVFLSVKRQSNHTKAIWT